MERKNPVIGVIGGMSTASSDYSKKLIYDLYRKETKGAHCPCILSVDLDMCEIEKLQKAGDKEALREELRFAAECVKNADFAILCTNTMHEFSSAVSDVLPFWDIRKITADAVRAEGIECVALFGTAYTMESDFYKSVLEKYGLKVVVPDEESRKAVHQIIYKELINGIIKTESKCTLINIIAEMQEKGAAGIILGCTELPLLLDCPCIFTRAGNARVFNTTRLQAEAAVRYALQG